MIRDNRETPAMVDPFAWQQHQQFQQLPLPMVNLPQQKETDQWAMTGIAYPGKHDVMLGRGGESNYHTGNLTFRTFIQEHKKRYQIARKQEKPIIALEVVLAWRDLTPPGRFLARSDPSRADSHWEDVGDDQACKRAGRTLGEKCSGKAAAKHQQASSQEDAKPSAAVSADAAISSSTPSLTPPKPVRRPKRPQASMDFIASFRSRQMASTSQTEDSMTSPPATKKRRATPLGVSRDFIAMAAANLKNHAPLVTPDNPLNKVMDDKRALPFEAIAPILDDRQREDAHNMRGNIPTAEFLTRTVFMDW